MDAPKEISELAGQLSNESQRQLLAFAQFLAQINERDEWFGSSLNSIARAYGPDEPEYSLNDCIRKS